METASAIGKASADDACVHLQLYIHADGLRIVTGVPAYCHAVTCTKPTQTICGKMEVLCVTYCIQHKDGRDDRSSTQVQGEKATAHETCLFMLIHGPAMISWTIYRNIRSCAIMVRSNSCDN